MNRLGRLAEEHWRRYLPTAYASVKDKESFFNNLGVEAQEQIEDLTEALRGPNQDGETFLARAGRYQMARFSAEAQILREMVLLSAEPSMAVSPQRDDDDDLMQAVAQFHALREGFLNDQSLA